MSPERVRDELVACAWRMRSQSAAVVVVWRQRYFDSTEPHDLSAFTASTHFEAGIMAGMNEHSAIYTRDSYTRNV